MSTPQEAYFLPDLHHLVATAVGSYIPSIRWNAREPIYGHCHKETYVSGRFVCLQPDCGHSWRSNMICLTIWALPQVDYYTIIEGQRCERCQKVGSLMMDEDVYAERVAYYLKKWAGVEVGPEPFAVGVPRSHRKDLCVGCRNGHCRNHGAWPENFFIE